MKKNLFALIAAMAWGISGNAQVLKVVVGDVSYHIPATLAGDMLFNKGESVTILDKEYPLSDITEMTVEEGEVTPASVGITYAANGAHVTVSGDVARYLTVTVDGGNVSILQSDDLADEITYTLTGESSDGSFFMDGKYKASLVLNGLTLNSTTGAAIDIEDGKRIAVTLAEGTDNRLSDAADGSQKGCFMVNGHTEFKGSGALTITGNAAHGFWGDEYVEVKKTVGTITVDKAVKDGWNINQYFQQNGGTLVVSGVGDDGIQVSATGDTDDELNGQAIIKGGSLRIAVTAAATKGLRADGDITISGGTLDITTSGNGTWDSDDNETKACAAIKGDSNISITGGDLTLTSTGSGGKAINADGAITIDDGTLNVKTSGSQYTYSASSSGSNNGWGGNNNRPGGNSTTSSDLKSSPKGIKADGNITINGGSIVASTTGTGAEAIESKAELTVNGGTIEAEAYDDALNSSSHMNINGGKIYVSATNNDGLDANGNLIISGGLVVAYGATSPECGLDANDEEGYSVIINGGTVIAVGGGTSNPGSSSTQPTIIYKGTVSSGSTLALGDSNGAILAHTMGRSYSGTVTFFITSPELTKGNSYTIYTGATADGDNWHGLYTDASTISSLGTSASTISSLSSPYSSASSSNSGFGSGGRW
jgi:hypothetical protein